MCGSLARKHVWQRDVFRNALDQGTEMNGEKLAAAFISYADDIMISSKQADANWTCDKTDRTGT